MLKQIKVITVYLHRKKVIGPIIDHITTEFDNSKSIFFVLFCFVFVVTTEMN